ncbi:MAG: lipopolysaccharide kinase InaA family protein [Phycisphaerae bacterium]|nr:lipopolysaccharide kinase InaA family protein [Phycisphaerae bacterium]
MSYRTVNLSGWKIKLSDDFPSGFESVIASSVNLPNGQRAAFERLTSSRFARVLRCNVLFRAKVYSLIIKHYFNRNIFDIFKAMIFPTRAEKAFNAGQMMTENGFLVPPAVACGGKFLITLEVKDSTPLYQLLGKLAAAQKQKMLEQFGKTLGKMHGKGIFHGDLRLGNILVKSPHCHSEPEAAPTRHSEPKAAPSRHSERSAAEARNLFDFYFLDNERSRKFNRLPMRLRVKNLVQANMHRGDVDENDRKIFFDAYISQQPQLDAKILAEKVISKTAKRLAAKGVKTV